MAVKLSYIIYTFCFVFISGCAFRSVSEDDRYELVWSDDFDDPGLPSEEKWSYDLGDGCPTLCGWGNRESQFYTNDAKNVRIEDGRLVIEVHKHERGDSVWYSSARVHTRFKGDWKYGLIKVRARLPEGRGSWPAIWMLPTDWKYGGWPRSGEIDIMEHVGYDPGIVHGTVHTDAFNHLKNTQQGDSIILEDPSALFHDYAIRWTENKIEFMVDGNIFNSFENNGQGIDAWPFDQPFHLILNIAVGGLWGGKHGIDPTVWPQRMEVDHVKVYQLK